MKNITFKENNPTCCFVKVCLCGDKGQSPQAEIREWPTNDVKGHA